MDLIHMLYGKYYNIHPLMVDCCEQGHSGAARARLYVVLAHKTRTRPVQNVRKLYRAVARFIQSHVQTQPQDYMIASDYELALEAARTLHARKKKLKVQVPQLHFRQSVCIGWQHARG